MMLLAASPVSVRPLMTARCDFPSSRNSDLVSVPMSERTFPDGFANVFDPIGDPPGLVGHTG
jgi:hypothetical protein